MITLQYCELSSSVLLIYNAPSCRSAFGAQLSLGEVPLLSDHPAGRGCLNAARILDGGPRGGGSSLLRGRTNLADMLHHVFGDEELEDE